MWSFPQDGATSWLSGLDSYRDLSMLYIHSVSDDKIRSDFYNNLGIQALAEKEYQVAHDYITYARAIDPKNPGVWQKLRRIITAPGTSESG